jgi:peptidylprolyl isomerase
MKFMTLLAGAASLMMVGAAYAQEAPPAAAAPAAPAATAPAEPRDVPVIPPPLVQENVWHLDLSTGGRVSIQLRPDAAPAHVERIRTLTRQGFYNGLIFHRVIEGFMAQGGDPTGTGSGDSDLPDLAAEFNTLPHLRGTVSMARTNEPNSANSQFFIMLAPRFTLDRNYTAFGRVIGGMPFVDAIVRGEPPMLPTRIVRASIGADNVPQLPAEELIAAAGPAAGPVEPVAAPISIVPPR